MPSGTNAFQVQSGVCNSGLVADSIWILHNQTTKKSNSVSPLVSQPYGKSVSPPTQPIVPTIDGFLPPSVLSQATNGVEDHGQPTVMSTSFICQQIHSSMNDRVY